MMVPKVTIKMRWTEIKLPREHYYSLLLLLQEALAKYRPFFTQIKRHALT